MNAKYPTGLLCDGCRPAWIAWRDADYDPARPEKWDVIGDNHHISHADRRRWREELQRSQMQLIVDQCRAAEHPVRVAPA